MSFPAIDFSNPPVDNSYAIPQEIYDYHIEHYGVEEPLNLEKVKEIFEILKAAAEP